MLKAKLISSLLLLCLCSVLPAAEIETSKPEEVGMSAEKLVEVNQVMDQLVTDKKLAGSIVMIAKDGKLIHQSVHGLRDIENKKPMQLDTILRIYSMSKAITSAGAMILVDQGKLKLDDPVSKYIPEMKNLVVATKSGTQPLKREVTVLDLMRHTSGFSYGGTKIPAVNQAFKAGNILDRENDLQVMCQRLAKVPLPFQPGEDWLYGVSTDVLGRVIEVVAEQPLDQFLKQQIFQPLEMKDTGFYVPENKVSRFAVNYNSDQKGNLTIKDSVADSRYLKKPAFLSGGGGLVSTARDYMRFLMMVAEGGQLHGKRILSKESIKQMTEDQLPKAVPNIYFGSQQRIGVGFSVSFSIRNAKSDWDSPGRVGEYGWGGAASTHYWVSPKDRLIVITMEQTMPYSFMTEFAVKNLIYNAINK